MQNLRIIFGFLIVLTASFAHADLSDNALVPKDEMNFAKSYLVEIRERNFDYVLSHIDPDLPVKLTKEKLEEIAAYFPSGQLLSTELIGSQVHTNNQAWQGNFSFEYEFESGWAVANVVMKRIDNKTTVIGFNVFRTAASQKSLNKFELSGKSALHYIVLTLACIVPVFIIFSLFYCIKTPIPKRKWLWVLFILGGIGSISINWSTGEFGFKILHYILFSASATTASEYAPWIITAAFPLGAIIFWFKRKSFIEQGKVNKSSQQDSSEDGASA